ncbi:hypothetical protein HMPREF0240_00785 [Clostridium sp. D5]|nr:hypothetical protein HMPREF0240_00785 [Clostridium sp. D5]
MQQDFGRIIVWNPAVFLCFTTLREFLPEESATDFGIKESYILNQQNALRAASSIHCPRVIFLPVCSFTFRLDEAQPAWDGIAGGAGELTVCFPGA